MEKYKQILARYLTLFFVPIVVLTLIVNLIVPDHEKSSVENRSLQQFPSFSFSSVLEGTYEKDLENWFSDQFVFRNAFIHLKYILNKVSGNNKIDDVFLAKGQLIEETAKVNIEQLNNNIDAINAFKEMYPELNMTFLLVPNAVSIQQNKLPAYAASSLQDEQMDQIFSRVSSLHTIDVRNTLKEQADEYLYYKTDHHWTSLCAFYTFQQMAKELNLGEVKQSDYSIYPVTMNFKGTLANKTGCIGLKDEIDIYVPKNNSDYVYTNTSTSTKSRSMYSLEGLQSNDPYTVFLNGNAGYSKLEMDNNSSSRLLIFKDSYANALIPFLVPYYRTITIVDPRYYFDDIHKIIKSECITDVLYCYNSNTFVQDTSLKDVLSIQ